MYTFQLPPDMISALWRLREYCQKGTIIGQVREAVKNYVQEEERRLGYPTEEIERLIEHGNNH